MVPFYGNTMSDFYFREALRGNQFLNFTAYSITKLNIG